MKPHHISNSMGPNSSLIETINFTTKKSLNFEHNAKLNISSRIIDSHQVKTEFQVYNFVISFLKWLFIPVLGG